jgi:hypothetical protein
VPNAVIASAHGKRAVTSDVRDNLVQINSAQSKQRSVQCILRQPERTNNIRCATQNTCRKVPRVKSSEIREIVRLQRHNPRTAIRMRRYLFTVASDNPRTTVGHGSKAFSMKSKVFTNSMAATD